MSNTNKIKGMSFPFYYFCFKSRIRKDYRKKLDKAAAQIEKEMDLEKFIRRQRQNTLAILSLLSGRQIRLVTNMSRLTVSDGSESSKFSDDVKNSDNFGDRKTRVQFAERYAKQTFNSTDKVDKQIIQLLNVRHQ